MCVEHSFGRYRQQICVDHEVVELEAQQAHDSLARSFRLRDVVRRRVVKFEEFIAFDLRLKLLADLNATNWRSGDELLKACAEAAVSRSRRY